MNQKYYTKAQMRGKTQNPNYSVSLPTYFQSLRPFLLSANLIIHCKEVINLEAGGRMFTVASGLGYLTVRFSTNNTDILILLGN